MTAGPDSGRIGTDEALRLLASDARRRLLVKLLDCGDEVSIHRDEAVKAIGEDTEGSSTNGKEDADLESRLSIELHHHHLPQLADTGIIAWDREADTISKGPAFGDLRPFVQEYAKDGDGLLDE